MTVYFCHVEPLFIVQQNEYSISTLPYIFNGAFNVAAELAKDNANDDKAYTVYAYPIVSKTEKIGFIYNFYTSVLSDEEYEKLDIATTGVGPSPNFYKLDISYVGSYIKSVRAYKMSDKTFKDIDDYDSNEIFEFTSYNADVKIPAEPTEYDTITE